MATLLVGCSKKTSPPPTVTFQGYSANGAMFSLKNPDTVPVICQLQLQPGDPGSQAMVMIPAGGIVTQIMSVRQTNDISLLVTVMRATPVEKFTVPMQ
jgi:hypothetical protein